MQFALYFFLNYFLKVFPHFVCSWHGLKSFFLNIFLIFFILFSLFLLQFIGLTVIFDTIHKFHHIILIAL